MRIRGIYAPVTTPFNHEGGIYWNKFDYNLSQLQRTKLSGILVGDRWGESPLLSAEEKIELWKRAAAQVGRGQSVLAAVAGCGVLEAREQVAAAAEAGCVAAVLETPDLRGSARRSATMELFFQAVADSSDLPVLADISLDGLCDSPAQRAAAVAAHPRIAGVLLASSDPEAVRDAISVSCPDVVYIVRSLELAVSCLAAGASAALLPMAAAVPFYCLSIEEAIRTREFEAARELADRAMPFERLLDEHGVPALKHALDLRGSYGGVPRLPLLSTASKTAEAVRQSLTELSS